MFLIVCNETYFNTYAFGEFKKLELRSQRQRRFKNELTSYLRILRYSKVIWFVSVCENYLKNDCGTQRKIRNIAFQLSVMVHVFTTTQHLEISRCHFTKDGKQRCQKYYVCASHCTALSPLFSDVPVAVTVVVVNFLFSVNRLLPFNGELK